MWREMFNIDPREKQCWNIIKELLVGFSTLCDVPESFVTSVGTLIKPQTQRNSWFVVRAARCDGPHLTPDPALRPQTSVWWTHRSRTQQRTHYSASSPWGELRSVPGPAIQINDEMCKKECQTNIVLSSSTKRVLISVLEPFAKPRRVDPPIIVLSKFWWSD